MSSFIKRPVGSTDSVSAAPIESMLDKLDTVIGNLNGISVHCASIIAEATPHPGVIKWEAPIFIGYANHSGQNVWVQIPKSSTLPTSGITLNNGHVFLAVLDLNETNTDKTNAKVLTFAYSSPNYLTPSKGQFGRVTDAAYSMPQSDDSMICIIGHRGTSIASNKSLFRTRLNTNVCGGAFTIVNPVGSTGSYEIGAAGCDEYRDAYLCPTTDYMLKITPTDKYAVSLKSNTNWLVTKKTTGFKVDFDKLAATFTEAIYPSSTSTAWKNNSAVKGLTNINAQWGYVGRNISTAVSSSDGSPTVAAAETGSNPYLERFAMTFDFSSIPSSATIVSANLKVKMLGSVNALPVSFGLVLGTAVSSKILAADASNSTQSAIFDTLGNAPSGEVTISALASPTFQTINIPSGWLSTMQGLFGTSGIMTIGLRDSAEASDSGSIKIAGSRAVIPADTPVLNVTINVPSAKFHWLAMW